MTKTQKALLRAIEIIGGQHEVARRRGVSQQGVFCWTMPSRRCPAEHARWLDEETTKLGQRVPASSIRPDVFSKEAR